MKKFLIICTVFLVFNFSCKKESGEEITPATKTQPLDVVPMAHAAPRQFIVIDGKYNTSGNADGNGLKALFNRPLSIFVNADGSLLVADHDNGLIRKIKSDTVVSTLHFPMVKNGVSFEGAFPLDVAETTDGAIGITGTVDTPDFNFYYGLWVFNPNGQSAGYSVQPHSNGIEYGGIDKDVNGGYFWYTGDTGVSTISSTGTGYSSNTTNNVNGGREFGFGDLSSCSNGVKYIIQGAGLYKLTKEGVLARILKNLSFNNISSICASTGGDKLYIADNGVIKVISNMSAATASVTTLLSGQEVSYIALSNSEKYLYFTSSAHHTVNKLTL
ncbi:hypothetical protein [Mucilaginibacter agri]|uniref:NHL repeat-containing protein n=1 Tax=Mucilaginibacter agri TaxID=2695265 RepID=A0A965ZHK1_9SPHI|nr:hypothetical protein [Mucilaginibacter agri]NCD70258.1 hypothetical protein [Mucilaginibacter agri]